MWERLRGEGRDCLGGWLADCWDRMGGPRAWKEMQKRQQEFQNGWGQDEQMNDDASGGDEEDPEGKDGEKRDLYAEYDFDPETENEKSQRPKGAGDNGELSGQEDVCLQVSRWI